MAIMASDSARSSWCITGEYLDFYRPREMPGISAGLQHESRMTPYLRLRPGISFGVSGGYDLSLYTLVECCMRVFIPAYKAVYAVGGLGWIYAPHNFQMNSQVEIHTEKTMRNFCWIAGAGLMGTRLGVEFSYRIGMSETVTGGVYGKYQMMSVRAGYRI